MRPKDHRKTLGVALYWIELDRTGGWIAYAKHVDSRKDYDHVMYLNITRWGAWWAAWRLAKNMNRYHRYTQDV